MLSSKFSVLIRRYSTVEPVQLAYASYESTNPPSDTDPAPLIINHGLFGSKSNWNSLCKAYHSKTHRKVIAADARNHGDSPHAPDHSYEHLVEDLKGLVEQLKFSRVALLGHSMGGRAVMYFALKYLVEKLIVGDISPIGTSPSLREMPSLFSVLQGINLPQNVAMSAARTQTDVQLRKFISDKGLRSFLLTNLVQLDGRSYAWRINIPALVSNFDEIARFPTVKDLVFEGPTLFVAGAKSDYLQKSDHEAILKIFPKAQFVSIEGAGHWVHSEKPTEFLQHTIEFLNKN